MKALDFIDDRGNKKGNEVIKNRRNKKIGK
jgi:hypothetical protein